MKKLMHVLYAELLIAAVLAALVGFLILKPPAGEETPELPRHLATEITAVAVSNPEGGFQISAKDGGFILNQVPTEILDVDTFLAFLSGCTELDLSHPVADPEALSTYGLDPAAAAIQVSFADGDSLTYEIGAKETLSGSYYFRVEGEQGVFLMAPSQAELCLMNQSGFISFYVTEPLKTSSPLSAVRNVTFTGGNLTEPVTVESVADGDAEVKQLARSFGAATHIVRRGGVYELDQSYGIEMLNPLCGMQAVSIVKYGLTPEQEEQLGFSKPWMQVDFQYKNGTDQAVPVSLRFLTAREDGSLFYANARGSGIVYVVPPQPFFQLDADKLLLRWFVSPLLMDVEGIEVETPGKTYGFQINQADSQNPAVSLQGENLDITLFRKFFKLLGTAAADGRYLGIQEKPAGSPLMTITYHYTEGKPDDVLALYPGESRRVNVFVNGICEFGMKEAFPARVTQALEHLQSGEDFDINW